MIFLWKSLVGGASVVENCGKVAEIFGATTEKIGKNRGFWGSFVKKSAKKTKFFDSAIDK